MSGLCGENAKHGCWEYRRGQLLPTFTSAPIFWRRIAHGCNVFAVLRRSGILASIPHSRQRTQRRANSATVLGGVGMAIGKHVQVAKPRSQLPEAVVPSTRYAQHQHPPGHMNRHVIASFAARGVERLDQRLVGNDIQQLPDGLQRRAIFQRMFPQLATW